MTLDPAAEAALIEAVRAAARTEILPRFRDPGAAAEIKTGLDDLVTEADRGAERAIGRAVAGILPEAAVVGEEAVEHDRSILDAIGRAGTAVIVDPVDGTWNFAKGIATFGVILAVTKGGETVFGLLYDPVLDDWVAARKGGGAWYGGGARAERPLRLADPLPMGGFRGYASPFLFPRGAQERLAVEFLRLGGRTGSLRCSCHEYRQMALGHAAFTLSAQMKPWDHAAGALVVEEAGGAVGVLDGAAYAPTRHEGVLIAAESASLLAELQERFAWLNETAEVQRR